MRYACLIYYDPQTLFGGSPEELGRRVSSDIAKWTAVAKAANIKND